MNPVLRSTRPLPPNLPAEAVSFLEEMGYLEPDRLAAGDAAPDARLFRPDGTGVRLHELLGEKPAVLVFGSYT